MVLSRLQLAVLVLSVGCLNERSVGAQAGRCGSCHTEQQAALDASAHGPDRTPLFSALHEKADTETCDSCHTPEPGLHPGLDCTTCHGAVGNAGEGAGQVVLDWNGPVRGPTGRAGGPHDTERSGFLLSSELCGTCHEVAGPPGFVETTFSEWTESPAADAGMECVDCHFDNHRLRGLQADGADLIRETLHLSGDKDGVSLTNSNPAHAVPGGAAWARLLRLQFDSGDTVGLSPKLSRGDQVVDSPLRATAVTSRSLEALETRAWPWPSGATRVDLVYFPVAPPLGSSAPVVVATATRP